jgi:hypothetical protein
MTSRMRSSKSGFILPLLLAATWPANAASIKGEKVVTARLEKNCQQENRLWNPQTHGYLPSPSMTLSSKSSGTPVSSAALSFSTPCSTARDNTSFLVGPVRLPRNGLTIR